MVATPNAAPAAATPAPTTIGVGANPPRSLPGVEATTPDTGDVAVVAAETPDDETVVDGKLVLGAATIELVEAELGVVTEVAAVALARTAVTRAGRLSLTIGKNASPGQSVWDISRWPAIVDVVTSEPAACRLEPSETKSTVVPGDVSIAYRSPNQASTFTSACNASSGGGSSENVPITHTSWVNP
jgi:hypothetical protein